MRAERPTQKSGPDIAARMDGPSPVISVLVSDVRHVDILVDTGCECFAAISPKMAEALASERIAIPPRELRQAAGAPPGSIIGEIVVLNYDIIGWRQRLHAYIIPGLYRDLIFRSP